MKLIIAVAILSTSAHAARVMKPSAVVVKDACIKPVVVYTPPIGKGKR